METDLLIPALAPRSRLALGALLLSLTGLLTGPAPVAAATTVTIRIGSSLSPAVVTVTPGTRLVWINRDDDRHRVRTIDAAPMKIDSGDIEPRESWSVVASTPGTYAYIDHRDRSNTRYHGRVVVTGSATTGGPSVGGGTRGGTAPGASGAGPTGAAPPARASVVIGDGAFQPASVTIAAGGSITFLNGDDRAHTATGQSRAWDTGSLAPGQGGAQRFPAPGRFAYLCAFHPEMQGVVEVVEARANATSRPAAPAAVAVPEEPGGSPAPEAAVPDTQRTAALPIAASPSVEAASASVAARTAGDVGAVGRAGLAIAMVLVAIVGFARLIGRSAQP
jgi:plastocyanin